MDWLAIVMRVAVERENAPAAKILDKIEELQGQVDDEDEMVDAVVAYLDQPDLV